jgi:hypothetical protein
MAGGGSDYELGSADDELARLELQGRALAPATRMIFDTAGLRPGMRSRRRSSTPEQPRPRR